MTTIRCPICNEEVKGENTDDLSMKLKMHLEKVHDMSKRLESEKGLHGNVEEFVGTDMNWKLQEGRSRNEEYIGTSDAFQGQKGRAPEEQFVGTPEVGGKYARPSVHCPLCGEIVFGETEAELSDKLREHLSMVHSLQPMTMEKTKM